MPALATPQASSHMFQVGTDWFEVEHARCTELSSYFKAAPPSTLLWCFNCERAFRLSAARVSDAGVSCGYADCAGEPLDFWSWDAYRLFVGAAPLAPEPERRYPLAA